MDWANIGSRPGGPGAQLCMHIPPDTVQAKFVREQIRSFARAVGVVDVEVGDFALAIGEAIANALEHAGAGSPVEVKAWLAAPGLLVATVADDGIGFEPGDRAHDPALPDPLCERGRGIALMRRYSDLFAMRSRPGEGTTVALGRFLRCEGDEEGDGTPG